MDRLRITFCIFLLSVSYISVSQYSMSLTKRDAIYKHSTPTYNAGFTKQIITDNSQWLNYTTLVKDSDPKISITVELASGFIPDGLELQIEASSYIGRSKGRAGTPTRKIRVSQMPRVLIDNIGTFYTGSERNEGHQLTFTFIVKDWTKLKSGTTTIYIQYTITQN